MEFTWIRATTDQVVTPTPAKVGTVIVTPSSDTKKGNISLYDGESVVDPKILSIYTGTGRIETVNFQPYLQTQRGLYLDIGGDVGEVIIQLMWEPE